MKKISSELVRQENIKVYSFEANTYDIAHPEVWNWFEQKRYQRLVNMTLEIVKNKKEPLIVDVGAGTGNLTLKYLNSGCRVISIDISQEMLSRLEMKLSDEQKKRCSIICSDVESALVKIPSIDGVCFSSVLHHLHDYKGVIQEVVARVNTNGFFFNVHDPLIQLPKSRSIYRLHRIVGSLDEMIYRLNAKLRGYNLEEVPDDRIAEYHQSSKTMDFSDLRDFLEKLGLSIKHFETYTSRRYGIFAWLATNVLGSENCFAYIARKE